MTKARTFDDLYREAETHDDYRVAGAIQDFTEEISRLMDEQGINRTELARRLGASPAYVTKILRGNANFTLASMVKLARSLGAELRIHLDASERSVRGLSAVSGAASAGTMKLVARPGG